MKNSMKFGGLIKRRNSLTLVILAKMELLMKFHKLQRGIIRAMIAMEEKRIKTNSTKNNLIKTIKA